MRAHPMVPLSEVFAVAPTLLLRVYVVKHNKVSHPEDLVFDPQSAKAIRRHDGFYGEAQKQSPSLDHSRLGSKGLPVWGGCLRF